MVAETQNLFLNVREIGDFLRLKNRALAIMRWMGIGSSFRKHGGPILYYIDELKEWSFET